jgi:hypothetical protein
VSRVIASAMCYIDVNSKTGTASHTQLSGSSASFELSSQRAVATDGATGVSAPGDSRSQRRGRRG